MGLFGNILKLGVDIIKTPLVAADDILSGKIIDPDRDCKTPDQIKNVGKDVEDIVDDVLGTDDDD